MVSLTKKGGVGLSIEVLIGALLTILFFLIMGGFFNQAHAAAEGKEHVRCKYSVDLSHGINIDYEKLGIDFELQPIAVECSPLFITEDSKDKNGFFKAKEEQVAIVILNKMRVAWWASGKGAYSDVWHDTGLSDTVCKPFYYFKTKDTFGHLTNQKLTKNKFETYLENTPLPEINQVSLANYISSSKGINNKYYILTDGFVDNQWYGIYVASNNKGLNAVLITEVKDSSSDTIDFMNNYYDTNYGGGRICDGIPDKDDKLVRIII